MKTRPRFQCPVCGKLHFRLDEMEDCASNDSKDKKKLIPIKEYQQKQTA